MQITCFIIHAKATSYSLYIYRRMLSLFLPIHSPSHDLFQEDQNWDQRLPYLVHYQSLVPSWPVRIFLEVPYHHYRICNQDLEVYQ